MFVSSDVPVIKPIDHVKHDLLCTNLGSVYLRHDHAKMD